MKVTQIANNQLVIHSADEDIFQSYDSIIAKRGNGVITLDPNFWDYSATTLKYLKVFLNTCISKKDIQKRIDDGTYLTENLNK